MTPEEKKRRLDAAARQYMRGEIDSEQFAIVNMEYRTDYAAAALALVQGRQTYASCACPCWRWR